MEPDSDAPDPGSPVHLRLLHVGSDRALATAVGDYLGREYDVTVEHLRTVDAAMEQFDPAVDCVLAAQDLPEGSGLVLLERVRGSDPRVPFVLYAAEGSEGLASAATRAGATHYVPKPTDEPGRSRLADRIVDAVETEAGIGPVGRETYHTLLADLLGGGDGATVVTDAEDTVVWVDETATDYFGLDREAGIGLDRRRFVRERLAPAVANRGRFTDRTLDCRGGDGDEAFLCFVTDGSGRTSRWLHRRCHRLETGPYAGGRVERFADVSELVRTEAALADLQRLMTADAPFEERLNDVLGLGTERLDLPYGFVTTIEARVQTVVAAVGDHPRLTSGASCPIEKTYCRRTLAVDDIVAIHDALAAGWGDDPAYEAFGLESYVGVPIEVEGDVFGTLCFAASEPRPTFAEHEELFVEMAATWAGYELDRVAAADAGTDDGSGADA